MADRELTPQEQAKADRAIAGLLERAQKRVADKRATREAAARGDAAPEQNAGWSKSFASEKKGPASKGALAPPGGGTSFRGRRKR